MGFVSVANVEHMNRKAFIEALFDIDDLVAWGKTDAYCRYPKSPWPEMLHTTDLKFCINPLNGPRKTENVTQINSLLFEMDKDSNGNIIPFDEQVRLFKESGLPWTTMVWSGTKSVHCIVRLEQPIPERLYKLVWETIRGVLVKKGCSIDPKTNLVPQLSRMPGSYRDGKLQRLIGVRSRVSLSELGQWFKDNGVSIKKPAPPKPFRPVPSEKSNIDKFKIAKSWTQKKHGYYSTTWTTGGWVWLVHFGINLRKLDCNLDQALGLAYIEWGRTVETGMGPKDIKDPITKGWHWIENKK